MASYNLAEAKAHLSALVERAAAGEEIEIKRRGAPIARIVPIKRPRKPIDVNALRALTNSMTLYEASEDLSFVERLRREDRY